MPDERMLRVKMFDAETEKAVGIKNAKDLLVWLPKSQIDRRVFGGFIEVLVPSWLADKVDLEFED
jgi:RecG-like helicase